MAKTPTISQPIEVAEPQTTTVQQKFQDVRVALNKYMIERYDEIDIALTAMITNQHCVLVGPPGTGKSMLIDALVRWLQGTSFNILMTKFTQVEEIFGPVDMVALQQSRMRRITTYRLPEAVIAFLDELFKGSSAILNTTLRVMNERVFENDGQLVPVPLLTLFAASNEWPHDQEGGKELGALFDRFLFRKYVNPISSIQGRRKLLWEPSLVPVLPNNITTAEVQLARQEAASLKWERNAMEAMETILRTLNSEGIVIGDRRQRWSVTAAQSFAYLSGASTVATDHLEVLGHTLWTDPNEQPEKAQAIVSRIANPTGAEVTQHLGTLKSLYDEGEKQLRDHAMPRVAETVAKMDETLRRLKALKQTDRTMAAIQFGTEQRKALARAVVEGV